MLRVEIVEEGRHNIGGSKIINTKERIRLILSEDRPDGGRTGE